MWNQFSKLLLKSYWLRMVQTVKKHIQFWNSANFEQKTEIEKTGSGSCHDRARFHSEYRKDENWRNWVDCENRIGDVLFIKFDSARTKNWVCTIQLKQFWQSEFSKILFSDFLKFTILHVYPEVVFYAKIVLSGIASDIWYVRYISLKLVAM